MNYSQQQRFNFLYEQYLTNLRLQGKRPATIDAYSRAVRRISAYVDKYPRTTISTGHSFNMTPFEIAVRVHLAKGVSLK